MAELEALAVSSERELIADLDAKHRGALEHVERQLQALQVQLQHKSHALHEQSESNQALQRRLAEERGQRRAREEEADKTNAKCAALQREVTQLREARPSHTPVGAEAEAQMEREKKREGERERERERERVREVGVLRERVAELEGEVREARRAAGEERRAFEVKYQKAKALADSLFDKTKQSQTEVERKEREVQEGRRQARKMAAELGRLEREKQAALVQLQSCRQTLKEQDKNQKLLMDKKRDQHQQVLHTQDQHQQVLTQDQHQQVLHTQTHAGARAHTHTHKEREQHLEAP